MLVVRKESKAHARYNSFRSAFELLETVGREPHDIFEERSEDLPPLQKLEQRVQQLETNEALRIQQMCKIQQQIQDLRLENEALRSRLDNKSDVSVDDLVSGSF